MEQFIARQPIFDREMNLFGYELLFRNGIENCFDSVDGDRATSLFLTGLFSQIDAIIGRPLPEILAELPLKKDITDAITGHGALRIALDLIEAFEQGNWSEISRLAEGIEIEESQLQDIYFQAAKWPSLLDMAH